MNNKLLKLQLHTSFKTTLHVPHKLYYVQLTNVHNGHVRQTTDVGRQPLRSSVMNVSIQIISLVL